MNCDDCTDVEQWLPVPIFGFETLYEVSNLGRVRSLDRWTKAKNGSRRCVPGRPMRTQVLRKYPAVPLCSAESQRKCVHVHRLVALAFIENPDGLPIVRHLDGDNLNPTAKNLAWGTYKDNEKDKARHGRTVRGDRQAAAKLNDELVRRIRALSAAGLSSRLIAMELDGICSSSLIRNVLCGGGWTHVE